ncbi:MAG: hypothetical protein HY365_01190 [Candidatus Aenigmarchaeota archaeon]|nr:hypothetical protein [Candidatus Aenigmarchaeota archaeon]
MAIDETEKVLMFNMAILTKEKTPYQLGYHIRRLPEGVCEVTYPIVTDIISGMIFYVGDRSLNSEVANAAMSQPNASGEGTVTVIIDRITGRRTLSIQNAANTEYGREILGRTAARYAAVFADAGRVAARA